MSMILAAVTAFIGPIIEPSDKSVRHVPQPSAEYTSASRPLYTDQLKAYAEGSLLKPGNRPVEWGYNAFLVFRVMNHREMLLVIGDGPLPDQTFLFVEGLDLEHVTSGDVVYLEQVFTILPEKKSLEGLSDGYRKYFDKGQLRCWTAAFVSGRERPAAAPVLSVADLRVGQFGRLEEGQFRVKAADRDRLQVDETLFPGCQHFVVEGIPLQGLTADMVISLPYVFRVVGAEGREDQAHTHASTLILRPLLPVDRLMAPHIVKE